MAHRMAVQPKNPQTLMEISVNKISTPLFPAPVMSTPSELGAFQTQGNDAALRVEVPRATEEGHHVAA